MSQTRKKTFIFLFYGLFVEMKMTLAATFTGPPCMLETVLGIFGGVRVTSLRAHSHASGRAPFTDLTEEDAEGRRCEGLGEGGSAESPTGPRVRPTCLQHLLRWGAPFPQQGSPFGSRLDDISNPFLLSTRDGCLRSLPPGAPTLLCSASFRNIETPPTVGITNPKTVSAAPGMCPRENQTAPGFRPDSAIQSRATVGRSLGSHESV